MTPSKILFYLCLSFIIGIFIRSIFKMPLFFLWGVLFCAIFVIFASLSFSRNNFLIIGFCLLFLIIGVLRMQISEFNILSSGFLALNDKPETITLNGIIAKEPDVRDASQKLKIKIEEPEGFVLVTTSRYVEYKYLDEIQITGKLETPFETEDFSYKNYLLKDGIYSVMDFPEITVTSKEHKYNIFSFLYEKILLLKQRIRGGIQRGFSPPQSSILEGTILGDNGAMSQDLKNKLNITGLRHVIAVSGTHVVILSSIIMFLLLALGFWRQKAFYIAITIILLYILFTGLPSSGVRAGVMGGLYLLAQKLGRQSVGSRAITLAAAVMLLINPLLLFYDVGFQLSFLAVLGLIYLEPFIKNLVNILAKQRVENFVSIVSTTFAAQIFTLPIMIYNFGNISFVSPITNLLILPFVYWLMIFGFLFSLTAAVSSFLGWIFFVPCWFLLSYFIKIIDFFSQPWALKTVYNIHWIWLFMFYLLIVFIIRFFNKKYSQNIL